MRSSRRPSWEQALRRQGLRSVFRALLVRGDPAAEGQALRFQTLKDHERVFLCAKTYAGLHEDFVAAAQESVLRDSPDGASGFDSAASPFDPSSGKDDNARTLLETYYQKLRGWLQRVSVQTSERFPAEPEPSPQSGGLASQDPASGARGRSAWLARGREAAKVSANSSANESSSYAGCPPKVTARSLESLIRLSRVQV